MFKNLFNKNNKTTLDNIEDVNREQEVQDQSKMLACLKG